MPKQIITAAQLFLEQQDRWLNPIRYLEQDYEAVYTKEEVIVGWPEGARRLFEEIAKNNTVLILGVQFGDEGKGAMIDREIEKMLNTFGIKLIYVIRYQGGANAGHTIYKTNPRTGETEKVPVHQIPSSIMYAEHNVIGIMDSGMIVNIEDLQTEITDAEKKIGDLSGKLILSQDATMATDLDRALEVLNRTLSGGESKGGTGKGISTAAASKLERLSVNIRTFADENWEMKLRTKYQIRLEEFEAHDHNLTEAYVPDMKATREARKLDPECKPVLRKVGTEDEFIERLCEQREWLLSRNFIQDTFIIHRQALANDSIGVLFEASQAVGLHPDLGRIPDVTSTDTTAYGVAAGTKVYKPENIKDRQGVFKITYMSSVGDEKSRMITDIGLKREAYSEEEKMSLSEDQRHAEWIRTFANEKGTTTGRYRDICFLDLELMRYNCRMGGIEVLAATHLDVAKKDTPIKVCTHYTNEYGEVAPYQPGLIYQKNLTPHFIELEGWDGEEARKAKSFDELPLAAQKFLAFIQRSLGYPLVTVTNGPERQNMITLCES